MKKEENCRKKNTADGEYSSDDDNVDEGIEKVEKFDNLSSFKLVLSHMKPSESINRTLQRLNKSKVKLTTAQRWKMKKQGTVDESSETITKLTGIVNEILTKTGNMNVYELTFEQIQHKINEMEDKVKAGPSKAAELDMYADDFDEKEKKLRDKPSVSFKEPEKQTKSNDDDESPLMWEYKISQEDDAEILGPFTTEQMQKKSDNGDFKAAVFCRKIGDERFYNSSRIDFDLYL